MSDYRTPPENPHALRHWRNGARAEAAAATEGMTSGSRELYDAVKVLACNGDSPETIFRLLAVVFVPGWPLRERLSFAWQVVRG